MINDLIEAKEQCRGNEQVEIEFPCEYEPRVKNTIEWNTWFCRNDSKWNHRMKKHDQWHR